MEVSYIFYIKLPVFDENILSADLTEDNETEKIIWKTDRTNLLTGLKINQKSKIIELNETSNGSLLNKINTLAESYKDISFKYKVEMENLFSTEQYFEKKASIEKRTFVYKGKKENKKNNWIFVNTLII